MKEIESLRRKLRILGKNDIKTVGKIFKSASGEGGMERE